jgi:hypothetical protein
MIAIYCILGVLLLIGFLGLIERIRLKRIARQREEDSICTFVRSLDYRSLDTGVIREVYNHLQAWLGYREQSFPIRVSDSIDRDYRMDPLDLDDMLLEVATKTNRDLSDTTKNPLYDRVENVGDMIEFICHQPRANNSA